jgi:phosphatidate cytidylyltransferase
MKMNKIVQRLLIFFVGIPLIIGLVFLKQYNHLALHIVLVLVSVCAADELYTILSHTFSLQPRLLIVALSACIPLSALIYAVFFPHSMAYISYVFIGGIMVSMTWEVITAHTFEKSNSHLLSSSFILFYSGYLITFISRMTLLPHSVIFLAFFLLMVFICDSFAWLFGNLFGKNNRGIIKASPNKSIAGFVGGIGGSVLSGMSAKFFAPEVFTGSILKVLLLGLLMACSSIIGDLVESVFKRSSDCKDSGHIIPGRGGILDSVDSILFSAPVYYLSVHLLYAPEFFNR